ncbi:GHKL domain-containing protein [Fibrisoma montanum]|uniref:histidine kinase n=1 Tax=Fibrisoma montanum TaxID=2305895 RepID=A0A418M2W5_9BACT|nr:ATP-binding protein [Fibrisoma montanum]RIV19995.1 GHKL domain-containing protein [Fibrisoma montanum]
MNYATFLLLLTGQLALAQTSRPLVKIISVEAGNNQMDSAFFPINPQSGKPVTLAYNHNYLHFRFINSRNPTQKSFAYKLTGLDYTWVDCTDCSQVQYAHLDGGDYTFLVKTTQSGDVPAQFSFTVEGNLLHKWWFVPTLFLYLLLFAGVIIYFFILFQFRQKLKEQRLIHKEKMASMAELTAGIAHEIQNPLNFVNNFSELGTELTDELKQAVTAGDTEEVLILTDELSESLQKITHHGSRASAIIKGMLEHSRTSTGQKEPANLNTLATDYLQIAYQGFRSRDKAFSCELIIDLAPHVPPVTVVAQDLGRVFLNLFNNAFYTVQQKQKTGQPDYQPTVWLNSHRLTNTIEIRIKDNGTGIPEAVKTKIFQPFFTTKPTGEGTGLGLSLSYDIITKGHGGSLEVNTAPGEFAEFIIVLPIS